MGEVRVAVTTTAHHEAVEPPIIAKKRVLDCRVLDGEEDPADEPGSSLLDSAEIKLHGFKDRFRRWNFLHKDHFITEMKRWEAIKAMILRRSEEILFSEKSNQSLLWTPLVTVYLLFTLFLVPFQVYLISSSHSDQHKLAFNLFLLWVLLTLIEAAYVLPQAAQHIFYILTSEKAVVWMHAPSCA